jgi:hypothetical protein
MQKQSEGLVHAMQSSPDTPSMWSSWSALPIRDPGGLYTQRSVTSLRLGSSPGYRAVGGRRILQSAKPNTPIHSRLWVQLVRPTKVLA